MLKSKLDRKALEPTKHAVDLMLDSGAFSAWKKGARIDLYEYVEFLQKNLPLLYAYVNLDVIPGRPGKAAGPSEVEKAAAESYQNYQVMRKAALQPIPVYHLGEREYWLRRILDSEAPWIGLGGSVGKPDEARYQFFSRSFELIAKHRAAVKVHGFGVTSVQTMIKFPWYSVDSTSWVMCSAMGSVMVPAQSVSGFDYSRLMVVRVSGKGNQKGQAAGFSDNGFYRKHLDSFLKSCETNLARVRVDQAKRNYVNIKSLLGAAAAAKVQLFFSTWIAEGWNQAPTLGAAGARNRLLSYYEIACYRRDRMRHLEQYVIEGALPNSFSRKADFSKMAYRARRTEAMVTRAEVLSEE